MKNNEIPQESKELIEMANAYQETGIYDPDKILVSAVIMKLMNGTTFMGIFFFSFN